VTAIGLFGGSFDPVHLGHVKLARAAIEQFSLFRLYVIPAFQPPHKPTTVASFDHRMAMTDLAFSGWPEIEVSDLERRRGGISFTIDTVKELRGLHPDAELYLLVGSDTSEDLPQWKNPRQLAQLARLLVARRPGHPVDVQPFWRYEEIDMKPVDTSATEIRQAVRRGRSIEACVPKEVAEYIRQNRLYQ
jgi:nicotinate-nucleotide adenylyltransferase